MRVPDGYWDRSYYHDYSHEPFVPPLSVISAGISRWGPDVRYYRGRPVAVSLNLITAGSARFVHRGTDAVVGAGEVTLTHPGGEMTFATGPDGMLHKRFVVLGGGALAGYLASSGLEKRVRIAVRHPRLLHSLFRRCYTVLRERDGDFVTELSMRAHRIMLELARSVAAEYPASLTRALQFVQRNLRGFVSLGEISRAAGTSTRTCIRLFKQQFGTPPVRFFLDQKMRWAAHLLLQTPSSIKEIAVTLGYRDPLYFSTQFRAYAGLSPRQYRRRAPAADDHISAPVGGTKEGAGTSGCGVPE